MPFLIVLFVVLIVVAIYAHRNAGTRGCRWREDRAGSKEAMVKFNCVTCGVKTFSNSGKPDRCLSALKSTRP